MLTQSITALCYDQVISKKSEYHANRAGKFHSSFLGSFFLSSTINRWIFHHQYRLSGPFTIYTRTAYLHFSLCIYQNCLPRSFTTYTRTAYQDLSLYRTAYQDLSLYILELLTRTFHYIYQNCLPESFTIYTRTAYLHFSLYIPELLTKTFHYIYQNCLLGSFITSTAYLEFSSPALFAFKFLRFTHFAHHTLCPHNLRPTYASHTLRPHSLRSHTLHLLLCAPILCTYYFALSHYAPLYFVPHTLRLKCCTLLNERAFYNC